MRLVNSRLARTVEELADYDFEICYVPGSLNSAADYFSRTLLGEADVDTSSHGPDLPSGLSHWLKPESGGDTMVECLRYWIREHRKKEVDDRSLRQELTDEVVRTPSKYGFKLDKHSRQQLKLMRLPGQLMSVDILNVFASLYDVQIVVHFGSQNPLVFRGLGKKGIQHVHDILHLQCLAGVQFNLLQETPAFTGRNAVLLAHTEDEVRRDDSKVTPSRLQLPQKDIKDEHSGEQAFMHCRSHRLTQCTAIVNCNAVQVCALLDTGAAVGLISASALRRIAAENQALEVRRTKVSIKGLGGTTSCAEYVIANVAFSPGRGVRIPLLVDRDESFGHCILLGANFLKAAGVILDFGKHQVSSGKHLQPMPCGSGVQNNSEGGQEVGFAALSSIPTKDAVEEHQRRQQVLRSLAYHVQKNTEPKNLPSSLLQYRKSIKSMKISNEVLFYEHPTHGSVPVVNKDWFVELAVATHLEMAHIGRDKLCDLLSMQVFCPGLTKVIADIVYCCKRCQLFKTTAQAKAPPTYKIECDEPFELVAADVLLLPRTSRGFIGCLVIIDHCSKWSMAIPIRKKTSAAVATAFEHHGLVSLLRKPLRVLTDNGPEFCGTEFEKMLDNWGINHVFSTPLRPEGNGAVERCNRSLSQALRLLTDSEINWDEKLARAMVTYNTTRHSELKESPSEFLLRQKHAIVTGPIASSRTQRSWKPGHPEFAPFRLGELVKKEVCHPGNLLTNKFQRRYDGPLTVTRVNNNGLTYLIKSEDGQEKRAHHSQVTAPALEEATSLPVTRISPPARPR